MKNTAFQAYLASVSACHEAREWAARRTARQSWDECERADWLLWWSARAGTDRKLMVDMACRFARTALPFVRTGEERPLKCIETAEKWIKGKATIQQVREACNAAAAAAYAAYAAAYADADAAAAAYAADAAAYAAYAAAYADAADAAAYAAAYAAAAAAYAADAAYAAADAAADAYDQYSKKWSETRAAKLQEFAALVRETFPYPGTRGKAA